MVFRSEGAGGEAECVMRPMIVLVAGPAAGTAHPCVPIKIHEVAALYAVGGGIMVGWGGFALCADVFPSVLTVEAVEFDTGGVVSAIRAVVGGVVHGWSPWCLWSPLFAGGA